MEHELVIVYEQPDLEFKDGEIPPYSEETVKLVTLEQLKEMTNLIVERESGELKILAGSKIAVPRGYHFDVQSKIKFRAFSLHTVKEDYKMSVDSEKGGYK